MKAGSYTKTEVLRLSIRKAASLTKTDLHRTLLEQAPKDFYLGREKLRCLFYYFNSTPCSDSPNKSDSVKLNAPNTTRAPAASSNRP